mmetsp:Transcript_4936/g.3549  ORF Transcript_4936/g.3549 Transcript_4936/m.3549 type:complete len:194 (+) Transcript_4936:358-939(+)
MRDDLENYKKIAKMSKELATYYSPFTPLQQYRQEYLIKLPQFKSEIIDLRSAMKETSANIDHLNKQIRDLEKTNLDLNVKNEQAIKNYELLEKKMAESGASPEMQDKIRTEFQKREEEIKRKHMDELHRLREKLDKAETGKVMIEKKLDKVERELKESKDICQGQKQQIINLYEQKKEIVYVDKPGKLSEEQL